MRKKQKLWEFALEPQDGNFMFSYLTLSKSLKRKKNRSIRIAPIVFLILVMAFNFCGLKSAFGWGEEFPAAQDSKPVPSSSTRPGNNEKPAAPAAEASASSGDLGSCSDSTPDKQVCTDGQGNIVQGYTYRQNGR